MIAAGHTVAAVGNVVIVVGGLLQQMVAVGHTVAGVGHIVTVVGGICSK